MEGMQKQYIEREELVKELNKVAKEFLADGAIQCQIAAGTIAGIIKDIVMELPTPQLLEVPTEGLGEVSDGFHTFDELYHHRAVLFSVICNSMPNKAWKSKLHDSGDMFPGMFVVGIRTSEGYATYHYDIDPYWDMFKVPEVTMAPPWDGHTPQDAINRISKLRLTSDIQSTSDGQIVSEWKISKKGLLGSDYVCSLCSEPALEGNCGHYDKLTNYCSKCGAKMKETSHED